jgi:hypothetical protein
MTTAHQFAAVGSETWHLNCAKVWQENMEVWRVLRDARQYRSGMNLCYEAFSEHIHAVMRADSRPEL